MEITAYVGLTCGPHSRKRGFQSWRFLPGRRCSGSSRLWTPPFHGLGVCKTKTEFFFYFSLVLVIITTVSLCLCSKGNVFFFFFRELTWSWTLQILSWSDSDWTSECQPQVCAQAVPDRPEGLPSCQRVACQQPCGPWKWIWPLIKLQEITEEFL